MAQDKQPKARFPTENEFLNERLAQEQPPRLAVRVAMKLAQAPGNFAEINRMSPVQQAEMIREGKNATIVSEAAVRQRRCAPEVQASLVACRSWPVGQTRLWTHWPRSLTARIKGHDSMLRRVSGAV